MTPFDLISPSILVAAALASECLRLLSLDLSGCSRLVGVHLSSPSLQSLDLSGCTKLSMLELSSPQLRSLSLRSCQALPEPLLIKSLTTSPALLSLDLRSCGQLKDPSISHNRLRELKMLSCPSLSSLSLHCPRLTELQLLQPSKSHDLPSQGPSLTFLHLSQLKGGQGGEGKPTVAQIPSLLSFASLTSLVVSESSLDETTAPVLSKALCATHRLLSLTLSHCSGISDALLLNITSFCPLLTSLFLLRLPGLACPVVASKTIATLWLVECEALTSPKIECAQLANLQLQGSGHLVAPTVRSQRLKQLSFLGCRGLTTPTIGAPPAPILPTTLYYPSPHRGAELFSLLSLPDALFVTPLSLQFLQLPLPHDQPTLHTPP